MSIRNNYVVLKKYWAFIAIIVSVLLLSTAVIYIGIQIANYASTMKDQLDQHQNITQTRIFELKSGISQNDARRWQILNTKKYILSVNRTILPEIAENYAEWIVDEADKYPNIDHTIVSAIIAQESRFRVYATSVVGAKGLMQIMPGTGEDMAQYLHIAYDDSVLSDPKYNIKIGTFYFHRLMTKYKNEAVSLAGYNGGYYQARRWKLTLKQNVTDSSEIAEIARIPAETKDYVPSVQKWKLKFDSGLKREQ